MNTNFLGSLTNFLKKRTFEFIGLILILTSITLGISFATYAPEDPSFIYGDANIEIQNIPFFAQTSINISGGTESDTSFSLNSLMKLGELAQRGRTRGGNLTF